MSIDLNNPELRKKRKEINPETFWMYRLHRWAWSREPDFKGYCPLFWSTWATLGLSPLICIGKFMEFSWKIIISCIPESKPEVSRKKPEPEPIRKPDFWGIIALFEAFGPEEVIKYSYEAINRLSNLESAFKSNDYTTRILLWAENNPNWRDFYPAAVAEKEREEQAEKNRQRRAELRKEFSATISEYVSWMVKPMLWISGLALGLILIKLLMAGLSLITLSHVVLVFKALGLLLAVILGMSIFVNVVTRLDKFIARKLSQIPDSPKQIQEETPSLVSNIFTAIGEGISFIVTTAKLIYTKECPLIVHSKTTKPIEKNN